MWYKIKKIYQWTNQVRPVIECDFTQSDCWFIYYWKTGSCNYGRDSNWLYSITTGNTYSAAAWKIPSSIYQIGNLNKIVFYLKATHSWCWWWISYQVDNKFCRTWINWLEKNIVNSNIINLSSNTPANTAYTYTIDLINKECYNSIEPWTKQVLTDSEVSTIRWYWTNWNLNITSLLFNVSWVYSYIQKANFYYEPN
jgi:hypothetical protein